MPLFHVAVGQNQWYHFGVCAPPILVYSGDWDVRWGYGILTHGHVVSCFFRRYPFRVVKSEAERKAIVGRSTDFDTQTPK